MSSPSTLPSIPPSRHLERPPGVLRDEHQGECHVATDANDVLVALNVTRHIEATIAQKTEHGPHLQVDGEKFTFNHLQVITNDFAQVIGKGAFATFYLGHSDELKLQSKCIHDLLHSRPKNLNEARQLLRIHHRNVVSLLGYCRDETFLALVYEYMPHGSLKDHFQGKTGIDQEYGELYYASDTSADRPMIVDIVNRLKECMELVATSEDSTNWNVEGERSVQFNALEAHRLHVLSLLFFLISSSHPLVIFIFDNDSCDGGSDDDARRDLRFLLASARCPTADHRAIRRFEASKVTADHRAATTAASTSTTHLAVTTHDLQ
ncbi:hypothetical protein ZIOFF_012921 [Zingiber officinale]|uniref:Protein kinase domain-containing protein n=1 Tax=Zingiber officinale TaxID=94328 RepID=A0A8J5HTJ1_ZINOF|nr:hypothetical protein ZIOFF_012921 [Zingiber officinale]